MSGRAGALRGLGLAAIAIAALALSWAAGAASAPWVASFEGWISGLGAWAPLVFVVAYGLATIALLPGVVLTMAGGALFGVVAGTLYVSIGATLGACGAFGIGRHLARDAVERRMAAHPRFAAIDRAVGAHGLKVVTLLRCSPLIPYNLLNYALGVTRVRFRDYALASVGMLPWTVVYAYLGSVGRDLAALGAGAESDPIALAAQLAGLLATAVSTSLLARLARRELEAAPDASGPAGPSAPG